MTLNFQVMVERYPTKKPFVVCFLNMLDIKPNKTKKNQNKKKRKKEKKKKK